jgi:hypothetical protein
MLAATKQIEIMVRVANGPASLGHLMAITSSCGTEVLAACSYWDRTGAVVMLVTEDARRAMRALEAAGFVCKANSIVLVETPDRPGIAAMLGRTLVADGINVLYSYAFRSGQDRSCVVFKTTEDDRALYVLEAEALIHGLATGRSRRPAETNLRELETEPQAA